MTGFARVGGERGGHGWTWEVKSVNARSLDVRFRLPPGLDHLEVAARGVMAARLKRGNISAQLMLSWPEGRKPMRINRPLLDQILGLHAALAEELDSAPPRLDALLAVRGVVEEIEEEHDNSEDAAREAEILATLEEALDALAEMRVGEGERLAVVLTEQLDQIASLHENAERDAANQPTVLRKRLHEQLSAIRDAEPAVSEERLAQELALLAAKSDVREELDRMKSHIGAARDLIAQGGPVGRRLDFLCQELNREANTLCAKAGDVALTNIGLDLKAVVEQFREQVQNIE